MQLKNKIKYLFESDQDFGGLIGQKRTKATDILQVTESPFISHGVKKIWKEHKNENCIYQFFQCRWYGI